MGIYPGVVIALEDEAVEIQIDNAVEYELPQMCIAVRDGVANALGGGAPYHQQVAALESGFHAVAVHDDIGNLASQLGGSEHDPDNQGQEQGNQASNVRGLAHTVSDHRLRNTQ